jgi:aryl-alcohol dehydrogenase-like predicted oxidoreductase
LGTDYVDLFLVHTWDRLTPAEEVLRTFDDLVRSGKIRYAGRNVTICRSTAVRRWLAEHPWSLGTLVDGTAVGSCSSPWVTPPTSSG